MPAYPPASPTTGLIGSKQYAVATDYTTTATTLTDVDSTNLVVTFVAPASGVVLVRLNAAVASSNANFAGWGLRDGSSDVAGSAGEVSASYVRASHTVKLAVTPGTSYSWKWAQYITTSGTAHTYAGTGAVGNKVPATMEVWAA